MAENTQPEEQQDKQKQFLVEKFGGLLEQIGEGYGQPLQEELIRRLERTISEFNDEVNDLITNLKDQSKKRHEELKRLWEQGPEQVEAPIDEDDGEGSGEEPAEMSEWERRLEEKAQATSSPSEKTKEKEEKPKKKGLFRKKSG